MADIRVRFGARLRQLRTARKLSQEKLAALAGLHRTFVSMVERGERNVTIATIEKLAGALAAEMQRTGRHLPCFVQVNIGEEPQKAGIPPGEAVAFVDACRNTHGLEIVGLMCIPPEGVPAGPYFAHLATLAEAAGLSQLSMGMSADFEVAIAMGATQVRVGSALFGARPAPPATAEDS